MDFSKNIINWYSANKRDLPWRRTKNPYYIWLSEIILQQTQVKQGLPYYLKFIKAFPTVFELANATEQEVLKLWQGLGYYSRARNLHVTAKYIANELNGVFPKTYDNIIKLKGVGDYTASAIASIAFNEATAVVDGNVYRVLSRFFGIETPINSSQGIKQFKQLASQLIDKNQPATFNQAIMEFGAQQCKPKNPYCILCPLQEKCVAFQTNQIQNLPIKIKKIKIKKRYFNYLVCIDRNKSIIMEQRTQKDIWQNLYQFPLLESKNSLEVLDEEYLTEHLGFLKDNIYSIELFNTKDVVHKLSHQHLYTKFWIVHIKAPSQNSISLNTFENYPVPALIRDFINGFGFSTYRL